MYALYGKRALDIALSVLALLVLAVPLILVAALVHSDLGSPVLFRQRRIGRGNRSFWIWKFRTMSEARDDRGVYLSDEERLTSMGKWLRAASIDELPSLLNVIKGEMSIIGPRPLPERYLSRYTQRQLRRHEVRPGLSSIGVIHGRNEQDWDEQFELDLWYVDRVSFLLDFKCIWDTIGIVFTRQGATCGDGGARCEFIGTADAKSLREHEHNYLKIQMTEERHV